MSGAGRTSLTEADWDMAVRAVRNLLKDGHRVTNRSLREASGLNYDQAIKFFALAIERDLLMRRGRASGIHYVAAEDTHVA